ncbi:MAG TPA: efflux RND transporter periplasmic adaptor subunit [Candidatus Paceibacterota bacterium]
MSDLSAALFKALPNGATSATVLSGYQTNVDAARVEVSNALTALTTAETAYHTASGTLTLAKAGATQNDVDAQRAVVAAAQASLASAQAAAAQTYLVAPISGTVSAQNANLGQTVTPGMPLVSIVADGKYQADAQVSEVDVAKMKVGDTVEANFAAYPDATFAATVTTVPPAATLSNGTPSYTVTVTFADNDERIKPGLSANLRIITARKEHALTVPTSAIITSGAQKFVYVKRADSAVKVPVTTGIESADGMTEITNGLVAGDAIEAFGTHALSTASE